MSYKIVHNSKSLADQVAEVVIERICNRHYRPGEKIGERKLSRELGMSQIPVREAFDKLVQRGWIEKIPQKGAFIRRFEEYEILSLSQIRQVIEAGAVFLIANNITDEQLKKLENISNRLLIASKAGDVAMYEQADMEFHRTIISFLENPRILDIYENILNQSHRLFQSAAVKAAFSWGKKLEVNAPGHQKILSAIRERNAIKAQQEIITHIKRGCQFAIMIAHAQTILESNVNYKAS